MWALVDTSTVATVLETTDCSSCANQVDKTSTGVAVTTDPVSGYLNNPGSSYSGVDGTATICIFDEDSTGTTYTSVPNTSNIATYSMPCAENIKVHFADSVASPDADVSAYLGMAQGKSTSGASYSIMEQLGLTDK